MQSKANQHSRFAKFIAVLGLSMTVLPSAASAVPLTYCQTKGHGANGCSSLFTGGGYCWANTTSTSGYVCRKDKPASNSENQDQEVMQSLDPIYDVAGDNDPGEGEVQETIVQFCDGIFGPGCVSFYTPEPCWVLGFPENETVETGFGSISCWQ